MNRSKLNLAISSLILSVAPWLYPIFAELMPPAMAMTAAPLAYLSCLASIVMAITAIVKRGDQKVHLALIALVLDILFIAFAVYSAVGMCMQGLALN